MIETLAHGYSSESTQRELFNEYQHDRVKMVIKDFCILVHWKKAALALDGLKPFFLLINTVCQLADRHVHYASHQSDPEEINITEKEKAGSTVDIFDNDMQFLCVNLILPTSIQLPPYDIPIFPLIEYCTDSLLKVPWGKISEIWMRLMNERWQLLWSILLLNFINHNLCFIHKDKEKCKNRLMVNVLKNVFLWKFTFCQIAAF